MSQKDVDDAVAEDLAARASLARTAALLTSVTGSDEPALAPAAQADFAPELETTPWGPARRLLPPLSVAGAPMRWDSGA